MVLISEMQKTKLSQGSCPAVSTIGVHLDSHFTSPTRS